jgi:hypothetical protein
MVLKWSGMLCSAGALHRREQACHPVREVAVDQQQVVLLEFMDDLSQSQVLALQRANELEQIFPAPRRFTDSGRGRLKTAQKTVARWGPPIGRLLPLSAGADPRFLGRRRRADGAAD